MTARILIIAGSDSGGGAGIQADIKTVTMLGGHAMTAITAVTAQNTLGVEAVHPIPTEMVIAQIDAVVRDIGVDAVKIGMMGSTATIRAVEQNLPRLGGRIVCDPVMVAKGGARLIDDDPDADVALWDIFGTVAVITPNIPELEQIMGVQITSEVEALEAGRSLSEGTSSYVVVKGGHLPGEHVIDWLVDGRNEIRFSSPRIGTTHSHGTGCTLATAISCGLGQGLSIEVAVERARRFVRLALLDAPGLGGGHGPMGHHRVREDAMVPGISLNQVTIGARDYAASVAFYRKLGLRQIVDSPDNGYARFEADNGATFSLHEGEPGGAVVYFESPRLDGWVAELEDAGLAFEQMPQDEDWLWREARLRDPAGNEICLYAAGENRRYPPWRVNVR